MSNTISPYPRVHSTFKKEFKKLRDFIRSTNRYDLKKIDGKLNAFEDTEHFTDSDNEENMREIEDGNPHYSVSDIDGCGLTKVKEDKSSFAIGDENGVPITPFEFIWVSNEATGGKELLVEVITKGGDARYFSVDRRKLDECIGLGGADASGAIGVGGADAVATDAVQPQNPGGAEIQYSEVGKEILVPVRGRVPLLYGAARGGRRKRRRSGRIYQ